MIMGRALPKSHKHVCKSVVHLLWNSHRFGRLFTDEAITNLLNTTAKIEVGAEPRFTKNIITAAVSTGDSESVNPLANFGIEHRNGIVFTHVSQCNQRGAKRQTTIGCFRNEVEAQGVAENAVEFEFPDIDIEIMNHNTNGKPVKVNVRECME